MGLAWVLPCTLKRPWLHRPCWGDAVVDFTIALMSIFSKRKMIMNPKISKKTVSSQMQANSQLAGSKSGYTTSENSASPCTASGAQAIGTAQTQPPVTIRRSPAVNKHKAQSKSTPLTTLQNINKSGEVLGIRLPKLIGDPLKESKDWPSAHAPEEFTCAYITPKDSKSVEVELEFSLKQKDKKRHETDGSFRIVVTSELIDDAIKNLEKEFKTLVAKGSVEEEKHAAYQDMRTGLKKYKNHLEASEPQKHSQQGHKLKDTFISKKTASATFYCDTKSPTSPSNVVTSPKNLSTQPTTNDAVKTSEPKPITAHKPSVQDFIPQPSPLPAPTIQVPQQLSDSAIEPANSLQQKLEDLCRDHALVPILTVLFPSYLGVPKNAIFEKFSPAHERAPSATHELDVCYRLITAKGEKHIKVPLLPTFLEKMFLLAKDAKLEGVVKALGPLRPQIDDVLQQSEFLPLFKELLLERSFLSQMNSSVYDRIKYQLNRQGKPEFILSASEGSYIETSILLSSQFFDGLIEFASKKIDLEADPQRKVKLNEFLDHFKVLKAIVGAEANVVVPSKTKEEVQRVPDVQKGKSDSTLKRWMSFQTPNPKPNLPPSVSNLQTEGSKKTIDKERWSSKNIKTISAPIDRQVPEDVMARLKLTSLSVCDPSIQDSTPQASPLPTPPLQMSPPSSDSVREPVESLQNNQEKVQAKINTFLKEAQGFGTRLGKLLVETSFTHASFDDIQCQLDQEGRLEFKLITSKHGLPEVTSISLERLEALIQDVSKKRALGADPQQQGELTVFLEQLHRLKEISSGPAQAEPAMETAEEAGAEADLVVSIDINGTSHQAPPQEKSTMSRLMAILKPTSKSTLRP